MNDLKKLSGAALLLVLSGACSPSGNAPENVPAAEDGLKPDSTPTLVDGHSSRDSLDWSGTYSGVTPCADCPGIRTSVTLHGDGRFERTLFYLERSAAPDRQAGQFAWNASGSAITLQVPDGDGQQYKVGENALIHLDRTGNPITGDLAGRYVLHKHLRDPAIENRSWTLVELQGRPLEADAADGRPSLLLDSERSVASGSASCNSFSGSYVVQSGNRISFGANLAVTMMACPDMATEDEFLDMLRSVENYAVADGVLSLSRGRMAPAAKFAVVAD
jgi:copper homeostasis protein (lipoprotein)